MSVPNFSFLAYQEVERLVRLARLTRLIRLVKLGLNKIEGHSKYLVGLKLEFLI